MFSIIDKILSTELHEAVRLYSDDLRKLGNDLYGIDCRSCENRLIEIYLRLSKNGKQIMKQRLERTAKLKEGVVLRIPQMGITWTNESLDFTDKRALEVLKEYKTLESRFEVLPEKPKQKVKKEKVEPKSEK